MDKDNGKQLIDDYSDRLFDDFKGCSPDIDDPRASREMLSEIMLRTGLDRKPSGRRVRFMACVRYAALFLIPLAVGFSVYFAMDRKLDEHSGECAGQFSEIAAGPGQRASATLPDGTKVWLSSGSRISYSRNFNENERDVFLSGEAYFDVARDEHLPFKVTAGELKIKVLGTEFNVKAYEDAETLYATLVRGSVEAETPTGTYRQSPDQQIVFSRVNRTTQLLDIENAEQVSSWKDGTLYYDNQSLGEIAADIRRIYGVDVVFADAGLAALKFSGSIPDGFTDIGTVLRYISIAASLNCSCDGTSVTIRRK